MLRERVAENVFVFSSEVYAEVNAGAVIGEEWSVLIDTLALPEETAEIKDFLTNRLQVPVRYIINTHYHADHTNGNYLFPDATIIGSTACRDSLNTTGREALEIAKQHNRELRDVEIILPSVIFDQGSVSIRVDKRTLRMIPLPGHTMDGIGVLVEEDRVLFSGDVMMSLPYIVDGDYEAIVESLKLIPHLKLENLVQGHGEVILRGEVGHKVRSNLSYLSAIRREVRQAAKRKDWRRYLANIDVESCGKSRILLNGVVEQLHQRNLVALFHQLYPDVQ
jgi:glyoxylase-like metal-dependent hydrolase (beta-lactamase superfamily II)